MYRVEALTKTYRDASGGGVVAVNDVHLDIEQGEFIVLLGPSGCGKTTTLRCLAGLEDDVSGRLVFGERTILDSDAGLSVAPDQRDIGMVFQSYALWPHMTVAKNIGYPLKVRNMKRELRGERWVEAAAELVGCEHLLDRYPSQLSGGQQQRVALARGLVARPDLMLFDEPLSNLDALLRRRVRNDLHELHRQLKFTAVYVTHDQDEALALADRIVVMRDGCIEQIDAPAEVYESPRSPYVANFMGMTNSIEFGRTADGWSDGLAAPVELPFADSPEATPVLLHFRPSEAVGAAPDVPADQELVLPIDVEDIVYTGSAHEVIGAFGRTRLSAVATRSDVGSLQVGQPASIRVPWQNCAWFDESGRPVEAGSTTSGRQKVPAT